jgi:hypothetical protein
MNQTEAPYDDLSPDGRHRLDRRLYRRRSVVEQAVCWLKECRRVTCSPEVDAA